ncbi:hypothetical protein D9611_009996 [Ephemerocybe angulata]|uniref:N-acetyltransferase domain-containing protein n=1 Tax=Ephemerocybe angulata TaxID=980116 RepID=A0A8H5FFJ6_9AGAR|nr:hypothetical protein D9611_009996 [Tulosesus angulatus]
MAIPTSNRTNDEHATKKPYVRLATAEDFPQLVTMGARAFVRDPVLLYVGNVQQLQGEVLQPKEERVLQAFISVSLRSTASRGGRIIVVAVPSSVSSVYEIDGSEKIASCTCWLPPNKRVKKHQFLKLANDGAVPLLTAWGVRGTTRMGDQYLDKVHHILAKSFKSRGFEKKDVDTKAWYLLLAMTDPDFQGRGYLPMLMRDQFAHAPGQNYILETTTEKAKNQYTHFGFEVQETFYVGKGKVGMDGLPASEEAATGAKAYPMVKVGVEWYYSGSEVR